VILLRVSSEARLAIADHAREMFFGMALGIEWDPPVLGRVPRLGDISVVHHTHDGRAAGGFTLRANQMGRG
jgi:hypothetical protein